MPRMRLLKSKALLPHGRGAIQLIVCFATAVGSSAPLFAAELSKRAEPIAIGAQDWPWWRGPTRDGVAPPGQKPPLEWGRTKNALWSAPLSGRGHASPTVVGERVFIPVADEAAGTQSVICFARATGRQLWKTDVHSTGLDRKGNKKTSQASSSIACDGKRLFVNFLNSGAVYTTALDLDGGRLWQRKVSDFATHQGFGSSPAVYQSLVFVTTDNPAGGAVAALDRRSGEVVWKEGRPQKPNYASPIVLKAAGKDQLLVQGCDLVSSFDPTSGRKLWETTGSTTECVTTLVTDGERVFASGGYPRVFTQAIAADGSGATAWQNNAKVYVPSMVARDGYLYAIEDSGVAVCWKSATGEEMWKGRLSGTFSASLILVGDNLWATNESGRTFIFKASPKKFEKVADNQLGDEVFATPVVCGNRVFHRVAETIDSVRQERLYCLGEN
jgi:outer membrane protein assembly factor BamB